MAEKNTAPANTLAYLLEAAFLEAASKKGISRDAYVAGLPEDIKTSRACGELIPLHEASALMNLPVERMKALISRDLAKLEQRLH
jgi:hypothetical protein